MPYLKITKTSLLTSFKSVYIMISTEIHSYRQRAKSEPPSPRLRICNNFPVFYRLLPSRQDALIICKERPKTQSEFVFRRLWYWNLINKLYEFWTEVV